MKQESEPSLLTASSSKPKEAQWYAWFLQLPRTFVYHVYTIFLFTWTDYKTILFPVTCFACATAPCCSMHHLFRAIGWVWIHLLMCNVSNQARSQLEDKINRPWRPLPSGRITQSQAILLRHTTVVICFVWSASYGLMLLSASVYLGLTTFAYDELGLASHVIGKNFCNIGGYTAFEIGATMLVGCQLTPDTLSWQAVITSGCLIFTTIHAQDFSDVEGDAAMGRKTFPLYAPEFSRISIFVNMVFWSAYLGWFWEVGIICRIFILILGTVSGARYYRWRSPEVDERSYLIFNIWLMTAHLLPLHARLGILSL